MPLIPTSVAKLHPLTAAFPPGLLLCMDPEVNLLTFHYKKLGFHSFHIFKIGQLPTKLRNPTNSYKVGPTSTMKFIHQDCQIFHFGARLGNHQVLQRKGSRNSAHPKSRANRPLIISCGASLPIFQKNLKRKHPTKRRKRMTPADTCFRDTARLSTFFLRLWSRVKQAAPEEKRVTWKNRSREKQNPLCCSF